MTNLIKFTPSNYAKIARGKRTLIGLGDKDFKLGMAKAICTATGRSQAVEITEVRNTRCKNLKLPDAVSDLFTSVEDLKNELQKCCERKISDTDLITIVRFSVG